MAQSIPMWARVHLLVSGVLNTGTLAKAGDKVLGGSTIGIRDGHIPKPFERDNLYTGKRELFDPNQVRTWACLGFRCLAWARLLAWTAANNCFHFCCCRCSCPRRWSTAWTPATRRRPGGVPPPSPVLHVNP